MQETKNARRQAMDRQGEEEKENLYAKEQNRNKKELEEDQITQRFGRNGR
jgi:hypothetical protein